MCIYFAVISALPWTTVFYNTNECDVDRGILQADSNRARSLVSIAVQHGAVDLSIYQQFGKQTSFILLQENYAKKDADCVERVKDVFRELKLLRVYSDYEENSYNELIQLIDQLDHSLPTKMFTAYADKIYKRDR